MSKIRLFEDKKVRSVWNEEEQKWYFSVVDVVEVLTDSVNPSDYLKKLRKRDSELGLYVGTNCPLVEMLTETGKLRKTLCGSVEQMLRIIQSIPHLIGICISVSQSAGSSLFHIPSMNDSRGCLAISCPFDSIHSIITA